MDNNTNIQKSIHIIQNLYPKQKYFDKYSEYIVLCSILFLVLGLVVSYLTVINNVGHLKENWKENKCNPRVIPFAGFIYNPSDKTNIEYTGDNATECVQTILEQIIGKFMNPIMHLTHSLSSNIAGFTKPLNDIRKILTNIRADISDITEEFMGKFINIMTPLQHLIISVRDTFGKINGTFTASIYTLFGAYYTLKAFIGGMLEVFIGILISLATSIVIMWMFPWTWGVAIAMTGIFISLGIPIAVMTGFVEDTFHIRPRLRIPSLPIRPRPRFCFDRYTPFKLKSGMCRQIQHLLPGDELLDNGTVTAVIKLNATEIDMFNLDGIIVSAFHFVKFGDKWILTHQHPNAVKVTVPSTHSYIYCINTTTKRIKINGYEFLDWDELNENSSIVLPNNDQINNTQIHKYLNGGMLSDTLFPMKTCNSKKKIKDIQIGDILLHDIVVTGIVKIQKSDLYTHTFNNSKLVGSTNLIFSYPYSTYKKSTLSYIQSNTVTTNTYSNYAYTKYNSDKDNSDKYLYHLLTDKQYFVLCPNIKIWNYSLNTEHFDKNSMNYNNIFDKSTL